MRQTDFFSESRNLSLASLPQAKVIYIPDFVCSEQANAYYTELENTLPWRQETIRVFGKEVTSPRLQSWHGDPDVSYQYSGMRMQPVAWTPRLYDLKLKCEQAFGAQYNSVLVNYYRDGEDAMGWHADDEPELGVNPTIASLTLGCSRTFSLKHKTTKQRFDVSLENGSLFIMAGTTQRFWQHSLPRRKRVIDGRINLTFRYIYQS
jgi:alkylated DNA repair dioxygenase AlkB